MFRDAKVGDRVWSFVHGWGVIVEVDFSKNYYPILVKFDRYFSSCFTLDGENGKDCNPILFWDEVKYVIPEKPVEYPKLDDKVLVWDTGGDKLKRHATGANQSGGIFAFADGKSSWANGGEFGVFWPNWEIAEDED